MANATRIKVGQKERVESGAVEFEYDGGEVDWPGLFIRGDDAFALATRIHSLLDLLQYSRMSGVRLDMDIEALRGLKDAILEDVIVRPPAEEADQTP